MIMGWKPKLPSCYTNTVQMNQQYSYNWRYRSRYNTSINAVKEAVKRVGDDGKRMTIDTTSN